MMKNKWYLYSKHLGQAEKSIDSAKIFKIPLKLLVDRPDFTGMSKQEFTALVADIRENGLCKPVLVTPASSYAESGGTFDINSHGKYRVVIGHNRCRALQLLGYRKVQCVIWDRPGIHNDCSKLTPISPVMDYQ